MEMHTTTQIFSVFGARVCVCVSVCLSLCVSVCLSVFVCHVVQLMFVCLCLSVMSFSWSECPLSFVQTVPPKGHATVQMTFTPPPAEDVAQEMDCISYALGYLSLDTDVSCSLSLSSSLFFSSSWCTVEPFVKDHHQKRTSILVCPHVFMFAWKGTSSRGPPYVFRAEFHGRTLSWGGPPFVLLWRRTIFCEERFHGEDHSFLRAGFHVEDHLLWRRTIFCEERFNGEDHRFLRAGFHGEDHLLWRRFSWGGPPFVKDHLLWRTF